MPERRSKKKEQDPRTLEAFDRRYLPALSASRSRAKLVGAPAKYAVRVAKEVASGIRKALHD